MTPIRTLRQPGAAPAPPSIRSTPAPPRDRVELKRPGQNPGTPTNVNPVANWGKAEAPSHQPQDPQLQRELRQRLHRIESIGRAVGGDFRMKIQEGDLWAYDFATNTITYRPQDLQGKSADYGIGVILHEAAHRLYSRWLVEPEMLTQPFLLLNNAVEDPRVNNILASRYAGARDFFKGIYDEDLFKGRAHMREEMARKLVEQSNGRLNIDQARRVVEKAGMQVPRHIQYGLGLIYDWYTDGETDPDIKDTSVLEALRKTREDYREAFRLKRDVFRQDLTEAEIQDQARQSYEIVRDRLWPVYQKLVEQDVDSLTRGLMGGPKAQQGQPSGQSGPSGQDVSSGSVPSGRQGQENQQGAGGASGAGDLPQMTEEEARDLARRVLEEIQKQVNEKLESRQEELQHGNRDSQGKQGHAPGDINNRQQGQVQRGGSTDHGRSTSDITLPDLEELIRMKRELEALYESYKTDYDRYHGPVAPYADELAGELKNFLYENTRPKFKRELYETGRKLNLRAAMQSEARYELTGEFDNEIWMRRNHPTERGYEFLFILDESGSMRGGEKWTNALQALVLAMEALDQLDIDFGVMGFSDRHHIHKELKEKFTLDSRGRILAGIESSEAGGTNDADAVENGIKMLVERGDPDRRKIMFVITDGEGKEEELKQQIERAKDQGIVVIGIGLGPGMSHIESVYPEAVLVERVSQLPARLAELLRQQIEGDEFWYA